MLRCGATFDENCAPLWDKGDFRAVERGNKPSSALRRRGFSRHSRQAKRELKSSHPRNHDLDWRGCRFSLSPPPDFYGRRPGCVHKPMDLFGSWNWLEFCKIM
jgi:hypothetical protein